MYPPLRSPRTLFQQVIFWVSVASIGAGIYVIAYFHEKTLAEQGNKKVVDKWEMEFIFSGYMALTLGVFSLMRFVIMSRSAKNIWLISFVVSVISIFTVYPALYFDGTMDEIVGMALTHIMVELSFVLFVDFDSLSLKDSKS